MAHPRFVWTQMQQRRASAQLTQHGILRGLLNRRFCSSQPRMLHSPIALAARQFHTHIRSLYLRPCAQKIPECHLRGYRALDR